MTQSAQNSKSDNGRIDWSAVKGALDMATVATRVLGTAQGRKGGKGRLWWRCPLGTHDDRNPSFTIITGEQYLHCFGCGWHGDMVALVQALNPSMSFPDAVSYLVGAPAPKVRSRTSGVYGFGDREVSDPPSGLPYSDALALTEESERRLWTPDGAGALDQLHGRGLSDATIRAARLGFTARVSYPTRTGGTARASGIVIPWFDGDRLALVKIRQDRRKPRYAECHRTPAHVTCYPSLAVIRQGAPLVVTEGELDALFLGQEVAGLACVITLGSASNKLTARLLTACLVCPSWFLATDNDPAGDRAAADWPARAVRGRPPSHHKDWTEARQAPHPINLRRWWSDVLSGNLRPALYTWDELSSWRWGPAIDNHEGGIVIEWPTSVHA